MEPRLLKQYKEKIVPEIQKKFKISNALAVPKIQKVVVNMGVGEAVSDKQVMEAAMEEMATITGQKPSIRKSKKAISNFKLREGLAVGCKVTLRRRRMYEFLDRLLNFSLPRIRDFNGVSRKAFDKSGNYSLGISDQAIFPEIDAGRLKRTQGMDISIVFDNGDKEQTFEILKLMGMPFTKNKKEEAAAG